MHYHGQEQRAKSHKKRPRALDTGTRYHNNNYYTLMSQDETENITLMSQEDREHHADEPGRPNTLR